MDTGEIIVCGHPTHKHAHADELTAIVLLMGSNDPALSSSAVGIGGGKFDEHGKVFLDQHGKEKKECAATLVANELGVRNGPLKQLLDETLECDRHANCSPIQIAEIIKRLSCGERTDEAVIEWAILGLTSVVEALQKGLTIEKDNATIDLVVGKVQEKFMQSHPNAKLHNRVMEELARAINNREQKVTGAVFIFGAISAVKDKGVAQKWLAEAFAALFESAIAFDQALEEVKNSRRFPLVYERFTNDQGHGLRLTAVGVRVKSDNPRVIRAFRSNVAGKFRADLLIQRNSNGNVSISTDKKLFFDSASCIQLIRFAEACARGNDVRLAEMRGRGRLDEVPQWYLPEYEGQILNGSLSHQVEPTALSDDDLIELVQASFDPTKRGEQIKKWTDFRQSQKINGLAELSRALDQATKVA